MQEQINFYYSATTNAFYPAALRADYDAAGTWPDDAQTLSDRCYQHLINGQSEGKIIVANEHSQPVLADPPAPSAEEIIARAESQKVKLMQEAENVIAPLSRAVKLGIATPEETEWLKQWEIYTVLLSRIDTSDPANIVWPDMPE